MTAQTSPARHWLDWQPADFDGTATQDVLFDASTVTRKPDKFGTPDMFADQP